MQILWAAFAATVVRDLTATSEIWSTVFLGGIGVLSCFSSFYVVAAFYQGHIYKLVSLPLALASFIGFIVWLSAARFLLTMDRVTLQNIDLTTLIA